MRFQIEFNFREEKQHFGLEDFMNTTQRGVENEVNLSFLMVNVSAKLLAEKSESCVGIIKINKLIEEGGGPGSIHQTKTSTSSA